MNQSNLEPEKEFVPVDQLTYEQAFAELEEIVANLETNERTLAESMMLFERGEELSKYCASLLERAELRVQEISAGQVGDFEG
jgi:exodeoxyribonuclease VII small subunit